MKFSLIMGTVGRTNEIERFLRSLVRQTHNDYELIVVDQNDDNRLVKILQKWESQVSVIHVRSLRGLSRARNAGLELVSGQIICFPDDDCWYHPHLLAQVNDYYSRHQKIAGLSGRGYDDIAERSCGRFAKKSGEVNKLNVWTRGISYTLFIRSQFINVNNLRFDEHLGLGSPAYSGEETDFLLQILKIGGHLHYNSNLWVGHPYKNEGTNRALVSIGYHYGIGFGRVLRKHAYPNWYFFLIIGVAIIGIFSALLRMNLVQYRYNLATLRGRANGYFRHKIIHC